MVYPRTVSSRTAILMLAACLCVALMLPSLAQETSPLTKANQPTMQAPNSWAPADIKAAVPPVAPDVPCPLAEVLKGAAERAQELVADLPKFAATETMQHFEWDKSGRWRGPQTVVFDYMVEMNHVRPDMLVMEETRDGRIPLEKFPAHIATMGLPIMAMVFHPVFSNEYDMRCEGLGQWKGRPAWQIWFQPRPDTIQRLRAFTTVNKTYRLSLRGRAWLDVQTHHPLRIESDLMTPIPEIALYREHLAVDYWPVHFSAQNEDLWLQQAAELFMDLRGHRYRRVHTFSNFQLFSVDVHQKDKAPPSQ